MTADEPDLTRRPGGGVREDQFLYDNPMFFSQTACGRYRIEIAQHPSGPWQGYLYFDAVHVELQEHKTLKEAISGAVVKMREFSDIAQEFEITGASGDVIPWLETIEPVQKDDDWTF